MRLETEMSVALPVRSPEEFQRLVIMVKRKQAVEDAIKALEKYQRFTTRRSSREEADRERQTKGTRRR